MDKDPRCSTAKAKAVTCKVYSVRRTRRYPRFDLYHSGLLCRGDIADCLQNAGRYDDLFLLSLYEVRGVQDVISGC